MLVSQNGLLNFIICLLSLILDALIRVKITHVFDDAYLFGFIGVAVSGG